MLSASKFYVYTVLLLTGGWLWILLNFNIDIIKYNSHPLCIFKLVTNVPCPSCGTTRGVSEIFKGNIPEGIMINPLSIILLTLMSAASVLLLIDFFLGKKILFKVYGLSESLLKTKWIIPLIVLIMLNWGWNISKGL